MAVVNSEAGQYCLLFNSEAEWKVTEVRGCWGIAQVKICLQVTDVRWIVWTVCDDGVRGCGVGGN